LGERQVNLPILRFFKLNEFMLTTYVDECAALVERNRAILVKLQTLEESLCERFSTRVYGKVHSKQNAVLQGFESGVLGLDLLLLGEPN